MRQRRRQLTTEHRMTSRAAFLAASAVVMLSFGSLAAYAAMPVAGVDAGSDIVQVQGGAAAPAGAPPAAAAPAATTTAPAATTAPASAAAPTGGKTAKAKKTSRKKEVDASVESGTVPKRYRSSVPKEYHHLIPFAK
jgi:hypothetical protein